MKFITYSSALVLALFLTSDAQAIKLTCPDDTLKLKSVLKAIADSGASAPVAAASTCNSPSCGCSTCTGGASSSVDALTYKKIAEEAAEKVAHKLEKKSIKKDEEKKTISAIKKV